MLGKVVEFLGKTAKGFGFEAVMKSAFDPDERALAAEIIRAL